MDRQDHIKTNREKRLTPKSDGVMWCSGCDRGLVRNWDKCPLCGKRNGTKTLKKDI